MSLSNLDYTHSVLGPADSKIAPSHNNVRSISNSVLQDRVFEITRNNYTLPENWPKIPHLKEHHWIGELSNCKTPSVKRAVSHVELVQSVIDQWLLKLVEDAKSQTSGSTTEDDTHTQELADLGADTVIVEVIALLAQLDKDRMETQEKYMRERQRAQLLRHKIDNLKLHHLQELPALVQREHEAFLRDLAELHWHATYTKRLQTRSQARFSVASRHNVHLRDGIDFVRQHVPLVQDKLVLEVEAMDSIRKAQGEADQELMMAHQIQSKSEVKSQETMTKASMERAHIMTELDSVRDDLTNISQQLSKSQATYKAYVHQMNNIHARLADNQHDMADLKERNNIASNSEKSQAMKVQSLHIKITEAEFDHTHFGAESQRQEQQLAINKDKHANAVASLEQQREALDVKLWKLARKKQEQTVNIQDYEENIAKCDQQKAADLKKMARMSQELERTSILLQQTEEQLQHHSYVNLQLKEQLQSEQYKTFQTEEMFKKTCESVRKQIQEEIHTKTVAAAQISSDLSEAEKVRVDLDKKKEKAKTVTDELAGALSGVLQKVTALRAANADLQGLKKTVAGQVLETEKQHKESAENYRQTVQGIEPQLQAVKGRLGLLSDQLQAMDEQSTRMTQGVEEMDAAQVMMDRVVAALGHDVQDLMTDKQELELQIESGKKILADLHKQFSSTLGRLRANGSSHQRMQKERLRFLDKQEADKAELIDINQGLASRYRQLQQSYICHKELMLRSYEQRVRLEAAITDMKQLKSFQSKLHSALVDYFKYRGMFSQAELAKLKQESSNNGVRVSELQVNMERALDDIAHFLCSQTDGKITNQQTNSESAKETQGPASVPPIMVAKETQGPAPVPPIMVAKETQGPAPVPPIMVAKETQGPAPVPSIKTAMPEGRTTTLRV